MVVDEGRTRRWSRLAIASCGMVSGLAASCSTLSFGKNMSDMYKFYGDDSEMNAAMAEAQRRLPEFKCALDKDARQVIPSIEGSLVKARFESLITHSVEHMWVEDAGFEGDQIVGTLSSQPNNIPELTIGEWVSVSPDDISDWVYRQNENTYGGFTVRVMQRRGLEP